MSTVWHPTLEEYNPNISKEKWLEILKDKTIVYENCLHPLACFYSVPEGSTCKMLEIKYGDTRQSFNRILASIGGRVIKKGFVNKTGTLPDDRIKEWPILFVGREPTSKEEGEWVWRLRPELQEALAEFGIEKYLYKNNEGNNMVEKYVELLKENKNIILHGAPGTGKTFLAKQIAEAMGCSKDEIGFCQFHPSYDYTDFVEGLRPTKNNGFERQDGTFKLFCRKALQNLIYSQKTSVEINQEKTIEDKINSFLSDSIENESEYELIGRKTKFMIKDVDDKKIYIEAENKIAKGIEVKISDLLSVISSNNDFSQAKDIGKFFNHPNYGYQSDSYVFALYKILKSVNHSKKIESENIKVEKKNYVFIIDEINRGELSKIFGELFFSIDPGYRGEEGRVNTQYQNLIEDDLFKDGFYVPDNVYIIGTMNDIDRSVESMDFAMRRRFTFVEVTAEESAENMNITGEALEKMTAINNVISKMPELGKSYCIGAAYFKDARDLQKLWDLKIGSLVYEYLRGIDNYTDDHPDGEKFDEIKSAYDNPDSVE